MKNMNKKLNNFLVWPLVAALALAGCEKQVEQNKTGDSQAESAHAGASEPRHESQLPKIGKPDLSTPPGAYRPMKNSADTIYAYYALFPDKTDFGKIAAVLSSNYREEADGFKKQDIVASLKGDMDADLKKARNNQYYFMTVQADRMNINSYDFEKKSFFNPGLGINQDVYRSYSVPTFSFPNPDGRGYDGAELRFANVKQFADVKVEDPEVARKMEGLREADKLMMNVYFYANDIRVDYPGLIADITKIDYLDPAGNVVFTQVR